MGKGKAITNDLGRPGQVGYETAGQWDYLYRTSTVKDERFDIGDKTELPDGRVFRYAKSIGACKAEHGAHFTYTGYTAYTAAAVDAAIGDRVVTVPAATHAALAKDELKGGYIVTFTSGAVQFRGIIGNDASILNVAFKVYLDAGLSAAVVSGTTGIETYQNPYAALKYGTDRTQAIAGVPTVAVSATLMYFWVQTEGPIFVNPQALVGVAGDNAACWRHDGSLQDLDTAIGATTSANCSSQIAGHKISGDAVNNGPLFMLK